MNENAATVVDRTTPVNLGLQRQLDALSSGACTDCEFVDAIAHQLHAAPATARYIISAIEQRYRRGEISVDVIRAIESRIARTDAGSGDSLTVDLKTFSADHSRCVIDPLPRSSVELGQVLRDRYILEERLGSGGMGTVFKALDRYRSDLPRAQQYVAIKIPHASANNREELLANLRREFHCAQMLSHRNIVNVYEIDRDGDVDFFTMELLEGELLSSVLARLQPRTMARPYAWAIIEQLGSGIAHAHARNVIHTDLKPQNIMVTNSGEVRILDFGASNTCTAQSQEAARYSKQIHPSAVTPAYASCELLEGRPADPRDDIYALACLSYELLEGAHPFMRRRSTDARDLGIAPRRPHGLSARQWHALVAGLSWHRAGRFKSVQMWLSKLSPERCAARQLPGARDLEPARENLPPTAPLRATALFVLLLITVSVWVSFARWAPMREGGIEGIVAPAAANTPESDSGPAKSAAPQEKLPSDSVSNDADSRRIAGNPRRDAYGSATPSGFREPPISSSASSYRIRSGERFAEIRVHRASRLHANSAFVWWTEAASAKPGIDYVHQEKVTQTFPKGKNSTSFFVKLVPNPFRSQREVFYIDIAEAGTGSMGKVARAAIWLPTAHDASLVSLSSPQEDGR